MTNPHKPGHLAQISQLILANPMNLIGLILFGFILMIAVLGSALAPYDPLTTDSAAILQSPSAAHWFGTDQLGRDILSRTLVAARLDLMIAISAVGLSSVVGSVIGAVIGFKGGFWDGFTSRIVDVLMAFPLFVLALAMVAALGNTVINVVYATAIINLPFYIRLARSEVMVRRNIGYVEAARVGGSGDARVLFRFLLPNIASPIVIQASVNLGWAVLNAAGLSFLGLGVRPPTPEWGIMVAEGARFIASGEWWVAAFPGFALMLTVFSFNMLGDSLRDMLDPRMRT